MDDLTPMPAPDMTTPATAMPMEPAMPAEPVMPPPMPGEVAPEGEAPVA